MHRVKRTGNYAALPAPPAGGTPGYFGPGDPGTSTPATIPGYDWFNSVQEEIVGVILGAGLSLDEDNNAQLLAALNAGWDMSISLGDPGIVQLPGGMIMQFGSANTSAGGTVNVTFPIAFPTAILLCFAVDRTTDVANAHVVASNDGSTTGMTIYAQTIAGSGINTGVKWLSFGY
jgi:hypothetical protein